tara:strand:+ start:197 stop:1183 length:987 start_codon:yes stop_codon:yes gene_type:complete
MRFLLSKNSKKELARYLMKKHKCNSIKTLSAHLEVPITTFQEWIYDEKRYLPEKIIPQELVNKLEILDRKEDNWGRINGGKKTYQTIIKKYGLKEIKRRQSLGGKKSIEKIRKKYDYDLPNMTDPCFLEFYGVLLGDGWIGEYGHKNKVIRIFGISGDSKLDRNFFIYLKKNILQLFNRNAYLKEKPKFNAIELQFSHKSLFSFFINDLGFPLGRKIELKINKNIYNLGYNKIKNVIRGIFDTDGSFYLDKTPSGNPYPCISIQMKSPILIKQLNDILLEQGFKVIYRKNKDMITLKGRKQINKWMKEIGSSNQRHLNKINALVAQSG